MSLRPTVLTFDNPHDKWQKSTQFHQETICTQHHAPLFQVFHRALDINSNESLVPFYATFSKPVDRVSHRLLLQKLNKIGVAADFTDILFGYLGSTQAICLIGKWVLRKVASVIWCATRIFAGATFFIYSYQKHTRNPKIQSTIYICLWFQNSLEVSSTSTFQYDKSNVEIGSPAAKWT